MIVLLVIFLVVTLPFAIAILILINIAKILLDFTVYLYKKLQVKMNS